MEAKVIEADWPCSPWGKTVGQWDLAVKVLSLPWSICASQGLARAAVEASATATATAIATVRSVDETEATAAASTETGISTEAGTRAEAEAEAGQKPALQLEWQEQYLMRPRGWPSFLERRISKILYLSFKSFTTVFLCVGLFQFFLLRVYWAFWVFIFMSFIKIGNFLANVTSNILLSPFLILLGLLQCMCWSTWWCPNDPWGSVHFSSIFYLPVTHNLPFLISTLHVCQFFLLPLNQSSEFEHFSYCSFSPTAYFLVSSLGFL